VSTVWSCSSPLSAGRPDPLCHYVIVREDLPLGVMAAQLVHAAGESSPGNLADGTYAVVLACPDEATLERLAVRLLRAGVAFTAVREPDPPYCGALMALGLAPRHKSELQRHLSDVPLLKRFFPGSSSRAPKNPEREDKETVVHGHPREL